MKTIALLILATTTAVWGSGWQLYRSDPSPAPNARSVCLNAPYPISVLCDGTPPRIYNEINAAQYIDLQVPPGAWGFADRGSYYVISNRTNSYIYTVNTAGSLLSSFRCPRDAPADLNEWASSSLYVAIPAENRCYRLDYSGSILGSYTPPGYNVTALEVASPFDDAIYGDPTTHRVYVMGYGSFYLENPLGLTSDRTAGYPEWDGIIVVNGADNRIYQYGFVGPLGVAPASWGKVKALLR